MKAQRSCWTCRARNDQCDGVRPTCQTCAGAIRKCQGYEIRLSWPKNGNTKRAIKGPSPPIANFSSQKTGSSFINTTGQDVELYHHLSLQPQLLDETISSSGLWRQPQHVTKHDDLLHYFCNYAYLSLTTFDATTLQLRDTLIRMVLAGNTIVGTALFHALLAFSSLHRDGHQRQAVQLKISAIHHLSVSGAPEALSFVETTQHVATSMLLGAFEIMLPSESSGDWLWYIWGAMDMIQSTCLKDQSWEGDIGHLLDWVYYHDAISRFPMRHWRGKSLSLTLGGICTDQAATKRLQHSLLARYRPATPSPNPTHAILNLLSEAWDALLHPLDSRRQSEQYHDYFKALERKFESLPNARSPARSLSEATSAMEVFSLATRIYLARASQKPWEPASTADALLETAFEMPVRGHACHHFFPLFILACEARTDDRRATILGLIDRTQGELPVRSMKGLKNGIQSMWVQQDLHADSDLLENYLELLSAVISLNDTFPSFV